MRKLAGALVYAHPEELETNNCLARRRGGSLSKRVESFLFAKLASPIYLLSKEVGSPRSLAAMLDAFIRRLDHWYKKEKLTEQAYFTILRSLNWASLLSGYARPKSVSQTG